MVRRRGIAALVAGGALVASALVLGACGGGSTSDALGGDRAQAVADWLKAHRCENVTLTNAKGTAPDAEYGLFLERSESAVLVACDKGPEDSALVWEFDDYDTMARTLHVQAEQVQGGPYCRLKHVAFTIGNVKDGVELCRSMLGNLACKRLCAQRSPDFVTQRGWTKANPGTIAGGPCGSHPAKPARLEGSTGPVSETEVILASPVDNRGCLRPNIQITERNGGGCQGGSATTHRCDWENILSYHCWPVVFDAPDPTAAVCMYGPWSGQASRVDLAPDPPPSFRTGRRRAPELKDPWGVELLDGRRCERLSHYSFVNPEGSERGRSKREKILYGCDGPGPALVGGLRRSGSLWTFRTVRMRGGRYFPAGTAAVRTAWYEY